MGKSISLVAFLIKPEYTDYKDILADGAVIDKEYEIEKKFGVMGRTYIGEKKVHLNGMIS